MTTNSVNINVQDGGLGSAQVPNGKRQVVIGYASAPSALNVPTLFAGGAVLALIAAMGYGSGVERAALALDAGAEVVFIACTTDTAGANSAIDSSLKAGTSAVTFADGAPFDDYDGALLVTLGGTIGTGPVRFKFTLDNGRTYSFEINLGTANTYAIPHSGITLSFGAGTLVTGDIVSWHSTAPQPSNANVATALAALGASSFTWGAEVAVTGVMAGSNVTALETDLDTLAATGFKFTRAFAESRDAHFLNGHGGTQETEAAWVASLIADFAAVDTKRACVSGGYGNQISPISKRNYRRPVAWAGSRRRVQVGGPHIHLGRVRDGSLSGFTFPSNPDGLPYHDERGLAGLDSARFMTVWTIPGYPGLYIKNPNLMAANTDFTALYYGSTMDLVCAVMRTAGMRFVNDAVRVDPVTGKILENDARDIERYCQTQLDTALTAPGYASAIRVVCSRNDNILTTKTINVTVYVIPLGYMLEIDVTIGFENPVLLAA